MTPRSAGAHVVLLPRPSFSLACRLGFHRPTVRLPQGPSPVIRTVCPCQQWVWLFGDKGLTTFRARYRA